jgi:hypothetical protein
VFNIYISKVKVKCTLVQAPRLCTGRMAHWASRGIALLFRDHGTRRGCGGQRHTPAALYPRERPGTRCTGGWVEPGAVWTDAENLAPTGIRSPDRPARSQSIYRLCYPTPMFIYVLVIHTYICITHCYSPPIVIANVPHTFGTPRCAFQAKCESGDQFRRH